MAETLTFTSLKREIANGAQAPVYVIHGEEPFYTDRLVALFENFLSEDLRDFNQYVFYGAEADPDSVVDVCRRYPMMAPRQVVILKEAQAMRADQLDKLAKYVENPSDQTLFVIAFRGEKMKGKNLLAALRKTTPRIFESKKLYDRDIDRAIAELLSSHKINVDPKAAVMLREFVGTDLSRIYGEIEKLAVALPAGAMLTPAAVEANIGVSKDYNSFELTAAIARRDAATALKIARYFRSNPKAGPVQMVLPAIFNLMANTLMAFYAPDKSDRGLMQTFEYKSVRPLEDIKNAMRNYNAWQVIEAIDTIRRTDAMSKGVGSRQNPYDLLDQLILHLVNAEGRVTLKG